MHLLMLQAKEEQIDYLKLLVRQGYDVNERDQVNLLLYVIIVSLAN